MPVLLPFNAFRSSTPAIYVPGKEPPPAIDAATLTPDAEPALFVYRQRFRFPGEIVDSVRDGIMGVLDRSAATVLPHEETHADRVDACREMLERGDGDPGSLWLWCDDSDGALASLLHVSGPPDSEAVDQFDCLHQLWPVTDPVRIRQVQDALEGKTLFLADGHHRFAAGWNLATIQIRSDALRSASPLGVAQIERDASRGILFPPKSSDFRPKLLAGLVMHRHQKENVTPPVAQRPGVRKPSS